MRSRGTKETQGVNGDAAALQRWMGAVDGRLSSRRHGGNKDEQAGSLSRWLDASLFAAGADTCPYPRHRGTDWRLAAGGPVVCGVCHPPARGLAVELVA